ncbi:D-alanyl-D-alanine carboxypeptidase family protein [Moraxella catarrhalis]|nr:M15 family metallopeptidase [Moraxella catarrhalis]MPW58035.1 D-alanyl-D-alanine carboxypeptidase family protein [Moraxella catarrhalis]MPW60131.1 D-alanyl-D-alanine carboxypeptidase family protein [Moraxella catarrhalis]
MSIENILIKQLKKYSWILLIFVLSEMTAFGHQKEISNIINNDTANVSTQPSKNHSNQAWLDDRQEVHGVFDQSSTKLKSIPKKYTPKPKKIHPEVYNSLIDMIDKTQKDNIKLSVVSAFRSYQRQKQIWENKWGNRPNDDINHAKNILKWSAFPGTSRHHWGTDVDFNSVETAYWKSKEGVKVYNWLQNNAPKYGFCQTYDDGRQHGYNSEPWHWSYMPVADRYLAQISNPAVLEVVLNQGVKGSEAVRQSGDLMNYVTSINACQVTYPHNQQQNIQTPQDLPPNDTNQSE